MNLTNEEIRIKIAESLGYEFIHHNADRPGYMEIVVIKNDGVDFGSFFQSDAVASIARSLQMAGILNYPESLDACAEFEKTLNGAESVQYAAELSGGGFPIYELTTFRIATSSALKRCLAYLKTKKIIP
jgi:hypothetical protein